MPQPILDAFLSASGGRGGVVGIIPTSTSDPDGALKEWKEDLEKAGLTFVALDVRAREQASQPELLERAKRCTGFWFSGGPEPGGRLHRGHAAPEAHPRALRRRGRHRRHQRRSRHHVQGDAHGR
ncbi:MAG: hypothetical protein IPI84_12170 [Holophagaceae bacterium]|nr:hypothetical protein [Holophagaceae bacterium]